MSSRKNQKCLYYLFIIITFKTLIAQNSASILHPQRTLTISDGIASNLEQDIILIIEKIALLNTQKSSYSEKIGNQTIKLYDIMAVLLVILESIQEGSPPLAGLAHEFLHSLPQQVSGQLNEIFAESQNLYSQIFDTGTEVHEKGLEVTAREKSRYIQEVNSIIKKYEKWLMETKDSYELKLKEMSSLE